MTFLKRFTLIAAILISPTCFGQIDGTGIICARDDVGVIRGFYFDSSSVVRKKFNMERDKFYIREDTYTNYLTNPDNIFWGDPIVDVYYSFSRKDGRLVEMIDPFLRFEYSCEVVDNGEIYSDRMESIRMLKQAEYEEQREGNVL